MPFGWVRDIYPLVGNNGAAQGFDLFNSKQEPKRPVNLRAPLP